MRSEEEERETGRKCMRGGETNDQVQGERGKGRDKEKGDGNNTKQPTRPIAVRSLLSRLVGRVSPVLSSKHTHAHTSNHTHTNSLACFALSLAGPLARTR
eukprot:EC687324.1.p3 GENE.EC687324.1~~EC687324.1.p3  ORF type:complete len:100 (-),score=26.89 EC687324.1:350-649(-)